MKYIASSIFFFSGTFMSQFIFGHTDDSYSLRLFPKTDQGLTCEISAAWLFIPFIISVALLVMAIFEDYKKNPNQSMEAIVKTPVESGNTQSTQPHA
jgi:hypothetical protein